MVDYTKLSDSELDAMVAQKMATNRNPSMDLNKLSDQELDALVSQKMNQAKPSSQEAELGFINRARFALEPIEANRIALLQEQFGQNAVSRDQQGNILVNGRPVNAPGFGVSDVAEFAGAIPEIIPELVGGAVGGGAGAVAGAPTGPGAFLSGAAGVAGGRAVGGALGSLFRQGLSGIVGTPQVADIGERAKETATSAGASILGGAIADIASPVLRAAPEAIKKILPQEKALAELTGSQGEREIVQQELQRLKDIATRQNIPEPSLAQAAQGKSILKEVELANTPLVGSKVRKRIDSQLKQIKQNLENITGEFIDADSNALELGIATIDMSKKSLQAQREVANQLYDQIDELGAGAKINKRGFFNKYRDFAGKYGLVNPDMTPARYSASSGLTREEFTALQNSVFDGMDAIRSTDAPIIDFKNINAQRKTLRNTVNELRRNNPNAGRILDELYQEINATTERSLERASPRLSDVFKEANKTYKDLMDKEKFLDDVIKEGVGEEKIIKRIMSDSAKVTKMKDIIGEDRVKEIGLSYVKDFMQKLGKSGVGRPDAVINDIKKNRASIVAAIGQDSYNNLIDNLTFLSKTNQPLTPTRESLYNLITEGGLKGTGLKFGQAIKSRAELAATEVGEKIKETINGKKKND